MNLSATISRRLRWNRDLLLSPDFSCKNSAVALAFFVNKTRTPCLALRSCRVMNSSPSRSMITGYSFTESASTIFSGLAHHVAAVHLDQLAHHPRCTRHHEQRVHAVGVEAAKVRCVSIVPEIKQQAHQWDGLLPNVSVYCACVLDRIQNAGLLSGDNVGAEWRYHLSEQMLIYAHRSLATRVWTGLALRLAWRQRGRPSN